MELFRERISALLALTGGVLLAGVAVAQTPAPADVVGKPFDEITTTELASQSAALLKQAQASASGLASVTLKKYPGHSTMLTVRSKAGGAEQHNHWSDIFVALDGEATVIAGGTIENSKESSPGELRGTRVVGGTEHAMHKGDIVHISPGLPHQTVVAPGKTFTYFVVKVAEPGVE